MPETNSHAGTFAGKLAAMSDLTRELVVGISDSLSGFCSLSMSGCLNAPGKPQLLVAHKPIALFARQPHAADIFLARGTNSTQLLAEHLAVLCHQRGNSG